MRKLKLFAMLAVAAALASSCAAGKPASPAPVAATRGGTVNATLTDMKIAVDRSSISAGPVTFVVKNGGSVEHELVVIQTSVAQDKIAPGTDAGKVDETGNLGETGNVIAGGSNTFTVALAAGHYVLICNEIGHYGMGMHMAFTVN